MTTTRTFGSNPFEVYLKPTNKIEILVDAVDGIAVGHVVAYNASGTLVLANSKNRETSSVLGVVTSVENGKITVVTQGATNTTIKGAADAAIGQVLFLNDSIPGQVKDSPPVALGTTRVAVAQKIDNGFLILGVPGIVNGLSYRGYVNISAIQPIGTVSPFIGDTVSVPKNWLLCDGSYASIDTYPELYRLIGSIYGPVLDGRFKLPDFRGRTLVGAGSGNQLTPRFIGELGGAEKHQLSLNEMPAHSHKPSIGTDSGVDFWWGSDDRIGTPNFDYDGAGGSKPNDGFIAPSTKTDTVGGNSPHNNMPPYSVANWIIRAKAESEFALLDVNVESLTNVDKNTTPVNGDLIRYDGSGWKFVQNKIANSLDFSTTGSPTNGDVVKIAVDAVNGNLTFTNEKPSGSNIVVDSSISINAPLTHTNGSARPAARQTQITGEYTSSINKRTGIIHIHGSIEIESTTGSVDGTVNLNLIGYSGSAGLDVFDSITIPHYIRGDVKSVKVPFHATVAAEIFSTGTNPTPTYKYSYYLSTASGSQFKPNKLTITNVKFVF